MNKKRDYTQEKMMRRVDAKKKRMERLVSGYVYHKHPGIYREALKFHDELNALYPKKNDLRKTQQYLAFVGTCKENEKTKSVKDSFTLEIPLMKLTPTTVIEETSVLSTVIEETSVLSTVIEETSVLPPQPTDATPLPLQIDDAVLQQIIDDLKSDTDLGQFFNDIDIDMELGMDPEIDIDIPDISPIERELLH